MCYRETAGALSLSLILVLNARLFAIGIIVLPQFVAAQMGRLSVGIKKMHDPCCDFPKEIAKQKA